MKPYDAQIKLLVSPVWHWGHSYVATFAGERQAIDFYHRKKSTCAFDEVPDHPIDGKWVGLLNLLYPRCEHGLSDWLCNGPSHYPPDHLMPDYIV